MHRRQVFPYWSKSVTNWFVTKDRYFKKCICKHYLNVLLSKLFDIGWFMSRGIQKQYVFVDASQMSISIYCKAICVAWKVFPDAVTMSPMHRRRRNKSVSIKRFLPPNHRGCIAGTFRLYGNMLTIIWTPALGDHPSPKRLDFSHIMVISK